MGEKQPRGRPVVNKMDRIPASPKEIAKAMFQAADAKVKPKPKPKPDPN